MNSVFEPVYFGFSEQDYQEMFQLDLQQIVGMRILDYGSIFNNFTQYLYETNKNILGVDPLFDLPHQQLGKYLDLSVDRLTDLYAEHPQQLQMSDKQFKQFIDDKIVNAKQFINHYKSNQEIYRHGALPSLDFRDEAFDLALCSHCLFTHSDKLDSNQHIEYIMELIRISDEVRIFPLIDKFGNVSEHLGPVLQYLQDKKINAEVKQVQFELQSGANAVLIIDKEACTIDAHTNNNVDK